MTVSALPQNAPEFTPNATKAYAITGCSALGAFPTTYIQALYQYNQLIAMWSCTNNFPTYDGTLFPEEAAYLHFLFNDIITPVAGSYYSIQGTASTEITSGGALLTVGASSTTGILSANSALTAPLTASTWKITVADLPLRALKRPWHPFVLREMAIRTALKNV